MGRGRVDAAPITAVLFDFGGTLFAHASLAETITEPAVGLGRPIGSEAAQELAERIDALAADPAESAHPRDLDAAVWCARWNHFYSSADHRHPGLGAAIYTAMHDPAKWVPYTDTGTVLDGVRRAGCRVGVISNTGWDVRGPFGAHGLADTIDSFTLSCEVGAAKPQAAIFRAACQALDTDPNEVLMVGDDPTADVGGVPLGIRTLLLPACPAGTDNGLGAVLGLVSR